MFDWQDLYYFTVLARTQSLSAAARELRVEHATVGRRIDALEKSLGLRLVDRLPRSRPLTEDGRALARVRLRQRTTIADGCGDKRARRGKRRGLSPVVTSIPYHRELHRHIGRRDASLKACARPRRTRKRYLASP